MLTQVGTKALLLVAGIVTGALLSVGALYFFPNLLPRVSEFPVSADRTGVNAIQVSYEFKGEVKDIETLDDGKTHLNLDISSDTSIPAFIVPSDALVLKLEGADEKIVPAKVEEIKVDSSATIGMSYLIGEKTWRIDFVQFKLPTQ